MFIWCMGFVFAAECNSLAEFVAKYLYAHCLVIDASIIFI